jgi:hypothetical protein
MLPTKEGRCVDDRAEFTGFGFGGGVTWTIVPCTTKGATFEDVDVGVVTTTLAGECKEGLTGFGGPHRGELTGADCEGVHTFKDGGMALWIAGAEASAVAGSPREFGHCGADDESNSTLVGSDIVSKSE